MRPALIVVLFLMAVNGPAKAEEVICGKDWVSFIPYTAATVDLSSVRFHMRKSDIKQGLHVFRSGIGFLRVRKGAGWGPLEDELKVPSDTYISIMRCLMGKAVEPS